MNKKTFTVDLDDFNDLQKHFTHLRSRYFALKNKKENIKPKKQRYREVLDLCWHIYNADIKTFYVNKKLSKDKKYYVYAHGFDNNLITISKHGTSNPKKVFAAQLGLTFVPMYIGKGCGDRINNKERNMAYFSAKKAATNFGAKPLIHKIQDHLNEYEAYELECKLINIFGLRADKSGTLCNLDRGMCGVEVFNKFQSIHDQIRSLM